MQDLQLGIDDGGAISGGGIGNRFPLADLTKPQVRELAAAAGLPVAARRESQEFVSSRIGPHNSPSAMSPGG